MKHQLAYLNPDWLDPFVGKVSEFLEGQELKHLVVLDKESNSKMGFLSLFLGEVAKIKRKKH